MLNSQEEKVTKLPDRVSRLERQVNDLTAERDWMHKQLLIARQENEVLRSCWETLQKGLNNLHRESKLLERHLSPNEFNKRR